MKSANERHPELEELYVSLVAGTESARKRKNLKNLWAALEHLGQLGLPDYRIANVARTLDNLQLSGPKAQSIRNVEGEQFRMLIHAFAAAYGSEYVKEIPLHEEIVASIPDLRTAAIVQRVLTENKSLKYQLDILKHQFSRMQPMTVVSAAVSDEATLTATSIQLPPNKPVSGQNCIFSKRLRFLLYDLFWTT